MELKVTRFPEGGSETTHFPTSEQTLLREVKTDTQRGVLSGLSRERNLRSKI